MDDRFTANPKARLEWRQYRQAISVVDEQIGRVIKSLRERELLEREHWIAEQERRRSQATYQVAEAISEREQAEAAVIQAIGPDAWEGYKALRGCQYDRSIALAAVSATSIGFAWFTDAFIVSGPAQRAWLTTIVVEAVLLLPAALMGKLPATFWPRPQLTDERSLFVATLASGIAVLGLNDRASWAGALLPVYGTLGLFSAIFAGCRLRFDRAFPAFAVAGLLVTLAALVVLI